MRHRRLEELVLASRDPNRHLRARVRRGSAKTYSLTLTQVLPATPDTGGDGAKAAQLIPVKVGLVDASTGKDLDVSSGVVTVTSPGSTSTCVPCPGDAGSVVLRLNDTSATFTFTSVDAEPVPSVLRGFSAPVRLTMDPPLGADELLFQLAHDSDPFNRWEAAQKMAREIMRRAIEATYTEGQTALAADEVVVEVRLFSLHLVWAIFLTSCLSLTGGDDGRRVW